MSRDYFDYLLKQFTGATDVKPFNIEEGNFKWYGLSMKLTNGKYKYIVFLKEEGDNLPGVFEVGELPSGTLEEL